MLLTSVFAPCAQANHDDFPRRCARATQREAKQPCFSQESSRLWSQSRCVEIGELSANCRKRVGMRGPVGSFAHITASRPRDRRSRRRFDGLWGGCASPRRRFMIREKLLIDEFGFQTVEAAGGNASVP